MTARRSSTSTCSIYLHRRAPTDYYPSSHERTTLICIFGLLVTTTPHGLYLLALPICFFGICLVDSLRLLTCILQTYTHSLTHLPSEHPSWVD